MNLAKLILRCSNEWQKVKATFSFYKQMDQVIKFELSESDVVKAQILEMLQSKLGNDHFNSLLATELSDAIVNLIESNNKSFVMDRVSQHFSPLIELIVHKTGLLCGVAGLWELNLKFLAHKLDIEVFEERRNEVRTSRLADICVEIKNKYPKINVDFQFLADIRHCLFHGNFQQLRRLVESRLSQKEKQSLKSKIVALHLGKQGKDRFTVSDDPMTNSQAIEMGPFFWFLSGGNSKLLDFTVREFEHGLAQIEKLTMIQSVSIDECTGIFNQLAVQGRKLSIDQEDNLFKQHQKFSPHSAGNKSDYLLRLYRIFNVQN